MILRAIFVDDLVFVSVFLIIIFLNFWTIISIFKFIPYFQYVKKWLKVYSLLN